MNAPPVLATATGTKFAGMAVELPVSISAATGTLIGIATHAARVADVAVLIVPASGESRTGTDRRSVRLARALAHAGLPSLRFDSADGGDSPPRMASDPRYDEDAVAAARCLLGLHPDAFVAVLAVGRAASRMPHVWHALARADLPLSALCLVDPQVDFASWAPRAGWWRRLFGRPPVAEAATPDAPEAAAKATDAGGASHGTTQAWSSLPTAVRAARSRLLVVSRGEAGCSAALRSLARDDRTWRKALRRSRGLLQLEESAPGASDPADWRELSRWLAQRLTVR